MPGKATRLAMHGISYSMPKWQIGSGIAAARSSGAVRLRPGASAAADRRAVLPCPPALLSAAGAGVRRHTQASMRS